MRLIDADKLIEQGWRLERHGQSNELVGVMSIADVPTAYNMEEVVKELKEVAFLDIDENYADDGQQMLFLHDAIEIVKEELRNDENNDRESYGTAGR